jgi:hypothetical protein
MKNWNLIRIFENVNGVKIPSTAILNENQQLADKLYFNTGKLNTNQKETVLSITNGDNYTKFIADCFYYAIENNVYSNPVKEIRRIYEIIKNYNKNVFPIVGLSGDINKVNGADFIYPLETRAKIIELFKQLPSIATRNLKAEIRQERDIKQLNNYHHLTEYLLTHISLITNRDEATQNKIIQKMFKNGVTMDALVDFVEDKQNLLGGAKVTRNEILKVVEENSYDMKIVYEKGKIMVVRVESPQAIKNIGCTSLWCFTYGTGFDNAYRQWNNYSTNDTVYVIIDFGQSSDASDFMHVVIKPIDWDLENEEDQNEDGINSGRVFDMGNDTLDNPLPYMQQTFGLEQARNIFTFEWE